MGTAKIRKLCLAAKDCQPALRLSIIIIKRTMREGASIEE